VEQLKTIDVGALSVPLSETAPCGENLEYDAVFLELEQAAQGKPEVQYGSTITPAAPADWQIVMALALQLMQRSRDLRVAVLLTRALLKLRGIAGLADGLALLADLIDTRWDTVHPQLDADDGNDPMLRVNILATLCEPAGVLRDLRDTTLVVARAHGSFSLRDIDIASGELDAPDGQEKVTQAVIEAAFLEAGRDALAATAAALQAALQSSVRIERLLTEKVGVARALDFAPLTTMLRRAGDVVGLRLAAMPGGQAALAENAVADTAPEAPGQGPAPATLRRAEIDSRDDVRLMLDKLCAYYAAHEPSSPVPLLLQRARRMVDKSFMELMQELAPDGLSQLAQVSGIRPDS
jgi:type VI secretion system protein ImpA